MRRRVALKLVRSGLVSREVVLRFESERQALAWMDHPCIARVFDAGTTKSGRPYFAMEFVEGEAIDRYCDGRQLSTSGRLQLFAEVCEGVQHAHIKGVMHRDLKPSNVLVTQRKFCRRHRTGVAAAVLALATLVAGLAMASVGPVRARAAERPANRQVDLLASMLDGFDPGGPATATTTPREILGRTSETIERELRGPAARQNPAQDHSGTHTHALRVTERTVGPAHPRAADALDGLGQVALRHGDPQLARQSFERSLAIREGSLGADHPYVARSLRGLSLAASAAGDAEGALGFLERRSAVIERAYGPTHLYLADTLHLMAMAHVGVGRVDKARRLFRDSIDMAERAAGPRHSYVSRGYYNLACLAARAGDRTGALALLREAVDHGFASSIIFDDPDLARLRGDAEFEALVAEVRRRMALRSVPD